MLCQFCPSWLYCYHCSAMFLPGIHVKRQTSLGGLIEWPSRPKPLLADGLSPQ